MNHAKCTSEDVAVFRDPAHRSSTYTVYIADGCRQDDSLSHVDD